MVKVKDGAHVRNRAAHLAVGVDVDGIKHVLGIWVQTSEGAKFWAGVCAELVSRGIKDVLIVCCDGLTGFPEAIEATWPYSTVQTCVVHLIRAAMRFVSYNDRKAVAAAQKPIYQAADDETARIELETFKASELGRKNPHTLAVFENAWQRFIPFLAFPPMLRRVIYTTDEICQNRARVWECRSPGERLVARSAGVSSTAGHLRRSAGASRCSGPLDERS